jgi:hypothetical protein
MSQLLPGTNSKPALIAWAKDPARSGAELASAASFFPEVDRVIAARSDAPPELLATLSHSSDKATRAKVTANANTPAADYLRMGQQFPKEFIANPLLDLLLLENPALLGELPTALLVQISKKPECPDGFLVWAASHPEEKVQLAVAMNPKAPSEALDCLRKSRRAKLRESVGGSRNSGITGDPELLFRDAVRGRLAALSPDEVKAAWGRGGLGLPQFASLSPEARTWRAGLPDSKLNRCRCVLAANPNVDPQRLAMLANDPDQSVRWRVAANPATPIEVLVSLAEDMDPFGCAVEVAGNPSTPIEVLKRFSRSRDSEIVENVARNPATPASLLVSLSRTRRAARGDILGAIAENPNAVSVFEKLAGHAARAVRKCIASKRYVPAVLQMLSNDADGLLDALENPALTPAILETLAKHKDEGVRNWVAENRSTPERVLVSLAKDRNRYVCYGVAQNPFSPESVLVTLANHKRESIRRGVAGNPSTPASVLAALSKDRETSVRCAVAANPAAPATVLTSLSKDKPGDVRSALAANPATPGTVLLALSKGSSKALWETAVLNPAFPADVLDEAVVAEIAERDREVALVLEAPERSAWFTRTLDASDPSTRAAVERGDVLWFSGSDPGKAVLSKTPISALLAVSSGAVIEPTRIARVVGSTDWLMRAAVARNPSTPPNLVKKLASDANRLVRALVEMRRGAEILHRVGG